MKFHLRLISRILLIAVPFHLMANKLGLGEIAKGVAGFCLCMAYINVMSRLDHLTEKE